MHDLRMIDFVPAAPAAKNERRRHHVTRTRVNELLADGWREFCREPLVLVRGMKRIEVRRNGAVIYD